MANAVSVPARMSIDSVASQMESMRIIAEGLEERSRKRQHFPLASSL
ncbi:hypothetical protein ALO58_102562 [Pseudomonas savastanoi pv. savastanoi]|nr:hypothetical protein ALO58_102562 [Pseudomonas savastanoi pv. savastanoi]RMT76561.1 hypothetical protein ALP41_102904 [Pseudomonas savastanoi pv. nerii]RMU45451.1 hypothetical protein ALP28_102816 [Pseudomonas savastanoi pv. nerii]